MNGWDESNSNPIADIKAMAERMRQRSVGLKPRKFWPIVVSPQRYKWLESERQRLDLPDIESVLAFYLREGLSKFVLLDDEESK